MVRQLNSPLVAIDSPLVVGTASMWEQKVSTPRVSIFQKKGSNNTYKVMSVLENTPLTCFDMMSDAVK